MTASFEMRRSAEYEAGLLSRYAVEDQRTGERLEIRLGRRPYLEIRGQQIEWPTSNRHSGHVREWVAGAITEHVLSGVQLEKGATGAWRRLRRFSESWGLLYLLRETQRVSSGRAAPRRWYPSSESHRPPTYLFEPSAIDAVNPSLIMETGNDDAYYALSRRRRRTSLAEVLRQLEIAMEIRDVDLSPYHTGIEVRDSVTDVVSSLIDVGYGASQAIPVVHGCLSGAGGPLFVEQPEIHLHPRAQGIVAELLANASKHRQVVVETHSVHVINRARILVAEGALKPADVLVLFVERSKTGTRVHEIQIDELGEFDREWPRGFFDERFQDTLRLLEIKGSRNR